MRSRLVLLFVVLAAIPTAAAANVIWPALVLTTRSLAWWLIPVSLVIECYFVWIAFRLSFRDTVWATLAANGLSAGIGLFFVPFLGHPVRRRPPLFGDGCARRLAGLQSGGLGRDLLDGARLRRRHRAAVFRYGFKLRIDKRAAGLILLANAITVGLALASLQVVP